MRMALRQITIVPTGMLPKNYGPNQRILVVERTYVSALQTKPKWKHKWTKKATFSNPHYKKAKDVKIGDFFVFPRVPGVSSKKGLALGPFVKKKPIMRHNARNFRLPLNKETAELIGYYIAKGFGTSNLQFAYDNSRGKIINRTLHLIRKYLRYKPSLKASKIMNTVIVRSGGSFGCRVFGSWCGNQKINKKIPKDILYHRNLDILRSCLVAYYEAKGVSSRNVGLRTKSAVLAHQLQIALARLGLWLNMEKLIKPGFVNVSSRTFVVRNPVSYLLYSNCSSVQKFFGIKRKVPRRPTRHFHVEKYNIYLRIGQVR